VIRVSARSAKLQAILPFLPKFLLRLLRESLRLWWHRRQLKILFFSRDRRARQRDRLLSADRSLTSIAYLLLERSRAFSKIAAISDDQASVSHRQAFRIKKDRSRCLVLTDVYHHYHLRCIIAQRAETRQPRSREFFLLAIVASRSSWKSVQTSAIMKNKE